MFAQRLAVLKRRMFMKRITGHYIRRIGFSLVSFIDFGHSFGSCELGAATHCPVQQVGLLRHVQ